jgi:hypothetical protein
MMEFSRAVLLACASVLGLLLYIVAGLLAVLALTNFARNGPVAETTATAALFAGGGFLIRLMAGRFA